MEHTIIITGSSSGLGLGFLHHYSSQPSTRIIALDISPPPSSTSTLKSVTFYKADITSTDSLASISADLKDAPIHMLIHCAGIRGLVPSIVREKEGDVAAAETLEAMDRDTMIRTLEINTWGSLNVVRSLLPHLERAAAYSQTTGAPPPKAIFMSSRMGSVGANSGGGGYAYRASKAALNAIIKSLSIDVKGVVFLALHPGRVETGLVEWKEEGAMTVEESLETCLPVIGRLKLTDSGSFLDRFGEEIRW